MFPLLRASHCLENKYLILKLILLTKNSRTEYVLRELHAPSRRFILTFYSTIFNRVYRIKASFALLQIIHALRTLGIIIRNASNKFKCVCVYISMMYATYLMFMHIHQVVYAKRSVVILICSLNANNLYPTMHDFRVSGLYCK